ncbi:mannosyltransferase [Flavivirga sp. 57AJ16]|uniref:mannosyltransferase n=1 Tax=Flavivirga sp. 57AJ16 TaxID=3025307 RepID=UPI00236572A4|nr:mannosyltransferase [Flavivirga sp. 57AJ16]MDD7886906.1 mannosyltransferase [Flavivirga sp. 57AJ16]
MLLSSTFFKLNRTPLLLTVLCVLFYITFAYHLIRTDYTKLIMLYVALFFLFYKLVQILKHNLSLLTWIAFGFRTIFILAIPNLSQDFYRFIWDGRMILEGINPYLYTVESFINKGEFPVAQAQELYVGMGALNASHFTNYPPINQLCFVIANLFPGKSILNAVIGLRLIIIAADFGTLYFGKKLLNKLHIPAHNIFWCILNPFIIIELTGNLHFEGVMIFFLIWSLYLLYAGKWQWAAIVLALSISVKLIPLIFLPLFFKWFMKRNVISIERSDEKSRDDKKRGSVYAGLTKLIGFYIITAITTLLLFVPFYSLEFINNYAQTVGLWFQNFEFNASIYYVAREIGYLFRGYNEIAIIGKITPIIVVLFVLTMAFFRKNKTPVELITTMLLVLSFYYFTATTVHPWYVATLLMLSIFTKYKFPLVWSFVIILSYLSYINLNKADKSENLWVIGLEYLIVYGVFIWETLLKKNGSQTNFKRSIL